jgi:hypothetical protein
MTRAANARIAGFTYLFYAAIGIASEFLMQRARGNGGDAAILRARLVPVAIAWLGVFASGLLVLTLPLQLAGFGTGPLAGHYQWLPALVYQIVLALWLLIKGVDRLCA